MTPIEKTWRSLPPLMSGAALDRAWRRPAPPVPSADLVKIRRAIRLAGLVTASLFGAIAAAALVAWLVVAFLLGGA